MGLLYENGNLSLSLSSLTECLRQQIKGAIIFWSKPQTVELKAQNISTCFRSYQDTCEMLNFSEVFKDIIAWRVFRTQHILKLSGNICWLCMERLVSKVRCHGLKKVCLIKPNISCRTKCSTLGTYSNWQEKQVYKHTPWGGLKMDIFAFETITCEYFWVVGNRGRGKVWIPLNDFMN